MMKTNIAVQIDVNWGTIEQYIIIHFKWNNDKWDNITYMIAVKLKNIILINVHI